jgi:hypothetical protein
MSYFWCEYHAESHIANGVISEDCLLVGPYSTKEEADEFGRGEQSANNRNT